MSWLTPIGHALGININTHGVKVQPGKLLTDAAMLAIPGVGGAVAKGVGAIPGIGGTLASGIGSVGSLGSKALGVLGLGGAAAGGGSGFGGQPSNTPAGAMAMNGGGAQGTPAAGGAGGLLGWLERNPALASAGASLIGNTVGGIGQGQIANANRAEQLREFNMGYGLNANSQAMQANRAAQASPLRDQAQYLLHQRLGLTPQAFQPHDIYNPSGAPQSGINLQQYGQRAQAYQPGMGGQSGAVPNGILQKLGYGGVG